MSLRPHPRHAPKGPVVLVVMDGIGRGAGDEGDAVSIATTPTLDRLWVPGARAELRAHGKAVGLPSDDDMGNSEVGHNALGAGKIYAQGAKLVNAAIASGAMFGGALWQLVVEHGARGATVHFLGLLSDGNVHSHIAHLEAMLAEAARSGCKRLFVHALIDGRDVPPKSALEYLDRIERYLGNLRTSGIDARIVSGGGRMHITMDRYEADWAMVERGWHTHVLADARQFASAAEAVQTFRAQHPGINDQDLPAFVVTPIAPMVDGDAVVMFNFRGDRAIEISRAFDDDSFDKFDRVRRPAVLYAGMMEYDGDLHIPKHYLVTPPAIERPMGEMLAAAHVSQLAISETQKYGHVTYFWNGNRSGMFDDGTETYIEIPSDNVPFEQRPWMKSAEITDRLIAELRTGRHQFARVNYANGDMVGHTGAFDATVLAVECVDLQLGRLAKAVEELQGILVVTADHGNADEMFQRDKAGKVQRAKLTGQPVVKTSHSLNAVPFLIHDLHRADHYEIDADRASHGGIANVTATCIELLGLVPPDDLEPSLLRFR
ncbi:MAG: 2,3-bisphosphoglycerate-independent phosphoglycerate mutase [Deltaproteobacteria bacterium]|nr:2,3-bisphosphoglycerate-independent phosphoglycerate mutase [Deltaproteobacteria bacterium]MDQ3297610.1 2,3-bisphosphoglycerate-independent phosphoglycerate mutase [Myxococcota bacterium]